MFLLIGENQGKFESYLNSKGYSSGIFRKDNDILQKSEELRKYNIIFINSIKGWKGIYSNSLWETDSFVFLFGKLPPIAQTYAGIRSPESVLLPRLSIKVENRELFNGLAQDFIDAKEKMKGFPIVEVNAGVILASVDYNGHSIPFLVKNGRQFYMPVDPFSLSKEVSSYLLDVIHSLLKKQLQNYGVKIGGGNTEKTFDETQKVIPSNFQGPNARDYTYVLRRVNRLFNVLTRFTNQKELFGAKVIDIGCGFGTLSTFSLFLEKLDYILGIDLDQKLVDIGNGIVKELGLEGINFVAKSMMDLGSYREKYDILISNNSINYLVNNTEYVKALKCFFDTLKPGGSMVCLTPSRLTPIEAFTKYPGVQFMPKTLSNQMIEEGKLTTVDYNYIKLPSPFELYYWMRKVGFIDVKVVDAFTLLECDYRGFFKPRFYIVGNKC